jgi:hypothetical protein
MKFPANEKGIEACLGTFDAIRADRERTFLQQVSAATSGPSIDAEGLAEALCDFEIEWQEQRALLRTALIEACAGDFTKLDAMKES